MTHFSLFKGDLPFARPELRFFFLFSFPEVFQSDNMDEGLTCAIADKPQSPVIPSKLKCPMTRVGTGMGSPLNP
jgi:hypothetical protein